MLIDFKPGCTVEGTISQHTDRTRQGHAPAVLQFFNHIQLLHRAQSLHGSALILLEDGIYPEFAPSTLKAPILTFNRPRQVTTAFLIPDPAYTHSEGYVDEIQKLRNADVPWEDKQKICFWRGAVSGAYAGSPEWRKNPRCQLALYSRAHKDSGSIDIAFAHLPPHITDQVKEEMHLAGIIENYVPLTDFQLYRYNIDIDGEFNAWKSCFLKLATNSLLFKVQSDNEQWYYPELVEWQHYVPIRSDFTDLMEKIEWAKENDQLAKEIAQRSTEFINDINFESQIKESGFLFEELFSLQKP